jgi:hypothetical protein
VKRNVTVPDGSSRIAPEVAVYIEARIVSSNATVWICAPS